ncbi:MAG TPA: trigger factor [Candidatus Paceibacterota bacterium]
MSKTYKKAEVKKDGAKVTITAVVDWKILEEKARIALDEMLAKAELPGFRKGKVPKDVFVEKVGELTILEEGAERAIADAYPEIVANEKFMPISRPKIRITKIAPKNDLEFEIEVETMPEITLPDYKKIAAGVAEEKPDLNVKDEEVDAVLHNLQHQVMHSQNEKDKHPEINDEFAKRVGNFENLEALKKNIRENIKTEKQLRVKDKRRSQIAEKLIAETKTEIPEVLIDDEVRLIVERLKFDLGNAGIKWDEYLRNIKKTEEEILKDVRPDAEKKVKLELIVAKIAREEKFEPNPEEIKTEVEKIMKTHPSADPMRAEEYVRSIFTNRKVFEFLEKLS